MRIGNGGLQGEIDRFFQKTKDETFNIRRITKGCLSKSRKNLAPEAFWDLNEIIWICFYEEVDYLGYHGHKLLAVDRTLSILIGVFLKRLVQPPLALEAFYLQVEANTEIVRPGRRHEKKRKKTVDVVSYEL